MFLAPGLRIWILAGKAHQGKVELTVLASAENKLEDVCFGYSRLQPSQIESILLGVDANSTLKSLDLRSGWTFVC